MARYRGRRLHRIFARRAAIGFLSLAAVAYTPVAPGPSAGSLADQRPNILLLVTDDQSTSQFTRDLMPEVFTQLVDEGLQLSRAYVNTSLCCPSRSEIMTGLFEHHTGVDGNSVRLRRPTLIQALHDTGYRTSLAGKFLNSMSCDPRPEFDRWVCQKMGSGPHVYLDPTLNVDGTQGQHTGYATDILATYTAEFIESTPADQPFFAMYTPISPHLPGYDLRCQGDVPPRRPPSFDEDTTQAGKPAYLQRGPLTPEEIDRIDSDHRAMTNAVSCLDPAISTILSALGDRSPDTLVILLSDNGYLWGEHRWEGKAVPYEEAVRIPMVIRYPAELPAVDHFTSDALVENVDLTATMADAADIDWTADGISLLPLIRRESETVRSSVLLEGCQGVSYPCSTPRGDHFVPSFTGIVTPQYKYLTYATGESELYDLTNDPEELSNVAGDHSKRKLIKDLASQLDAVLARPPVETTIVSGPEGTVSAGVYTFVYFAQSRFATYECRLTVNSVPGSWSPCTTTGYRVTVTTPGAYLFEVRATDEGGATDQTPAGRSFQL